METIIQVDDRLLVRGRKLRAVIFFLAPVLLAIFGGILVGFLTWVFLPIAALSWVGAAVGATGGIVAFLAICHMFIVKNNTTGLLVTLDQLQSLLGNDPNVVYGPGTHLCFPWEARFARNNIPVEEVAEDFTFTALCQDGTLTGKGSFRLRPDFENPINYLSGVAAVGKDLHDLVVTFITGWFADRTMENAFKEKAELNRALNEVFVVGKTEFERRFGVKLGDITVSEILMSDEVQRTRGALNEGRVIVQGTAILLGFKTVAEMQAALKAGSITQEDVDRARREFRIISGNMDGATVSRFEVDIRGLSSEVATALGALLQNPNAAAALKGLSGSKSPAPKGKK